MSTATGHVLERAMSTHRQAESQAGSETAERPFVLEMTDYERDCFRQFAIRSLKPENVSEFLSAPDQREVVLQVKGRLTDGSNEVMSLSVVVRAGDIKDAHRIPDDHLLKRFMQSPSASLRRRVGSMNPVEDFLPLICRVIVAKSPYTDANGLLHWLMAQEQDVFVSYVAGMEHVARVGWDHATIQAQMLRTAGEAGEARARNQRHLYYSLLITELVNRERQNPTRMQPLLPDSKLQSNR